MVEHREDEAAEPGVARWPTRARQWDGRAPILWERGSAS
jgi:hypothetical protein